jgi:hypothetical protein
MRADNLGRTLNESKQVMKIAYFMIHTRLLEQIRITGISNEDLEQSFAAS